MKRHLVHAVVGLFVLAAFAPSAFATWNQTNWPTSSSFFKLYSSQTQVIAQTWDSINGGRTYLTSNAGANWTRIAAADSNTDILCLAKVNSNILAGTWNGLYQSTNNGTSWTALTPTGLPADSAVSAIAMLGTTLYAGSMGAAYRSTDNGTTWTAIAGIPAGTRVNCFAASGSAILAGTDTNGVYTTTSSGTSFTAASSGLTDKKINQIVVSGSKTFAVTLGGLFFSTNNGTSWTASTSNPSRTSCLAVGKTQLVAGTDGYGASYSADNGTTWNRSGMIAPTSVFSLTAIGDSIYAGTNTGVWVTNSSLITPVEKSVSSRSTASGMQFRRLNGSHASVEFSIPSSQMVNIALYDLRGNKVASLADEQFAAGTHTVSFITKSIAPGSYIVRLTTEKAVRQQAVPITR